MAPVLAATMYLNGCMATASTVRHWKQPNYRSGDGSSIVDYIWTNLPEEETQGGALLPQHLTIIRLSLMSTTGIVKRTLPTTDRADITTSATVSRSKRTKTLQKHTKNALIS